MKYGVMIWGGSRVTISPGLNPPGPFKPREEWDHAASFLFVAVVNWVTGSVFSSIVYGVQFVAIAFATQTEGYCRCAEIIGR